LSQRTGFHRRAARPGRGTASTTGSATGSSWAPYDRVPGCGAPWTGQPAPGRCNVRVPNRPVRQRHQPTGMAALRP